MKKVLGNSLIVALAVSALWALPASAQRRGDRDAYSAPSGNQIIDMADARIATLKADLRLSPDQEKNWDGFQSAIHDIAVQRVDAMTEPTSGRSVASDNTTANSTNNPAPVNNPDTNPQAEPSASDKTAGNEAQNKTDDIQSLRSEADVLDRRAAELKKIADTAQPLYASLDNSQRSRLMNFIRSNAANDQPTSNQRRRQRG